MDIAALEMHIESLVAPIVAGFGMEMVDCVVTRASGRWRLRLSIDYPQGGITIDDCARVSRSIEGVLDVEGGIPGAYHLEVSSPGLDRRVRTTREFARCIGRVIDVRTKTPIDGRSRYTGCLKEVAEAEIHIEVDRRTWKVPLSQIATARLRYFETAS